MPHAGKDNLSFFLDAATFVEHGAPAFSGPDSRWWSWAIAWIFRAFDESMWLGYAFNQWIFFIAAVQFLGFYQHLNGRRGQWLALLLFGLVPSSLLYSNLLFRESFQILMLIIIIRNLEAYRVKGSLIALTVAAAAFIPFGAIHNGLFLYAPMAFGLALAARYLMTPARSPWSFSAGQIKAVGVGAFLLVCGALAVIAFFPDQWRVQQILSGDVNLGRVVAETAAAGARTTFPWRPEPGTINTILFAPIQLFQFLFAPIVPNMIYEGQDLVVAVDASIRIAMMIGAVRLWLKGDAKTRKKILFLAALYLAFCLLAAMGTRTSGTAMRHHLKVFWLIIALGVPGLPALVWTSIRSHQPAATSLPPLQ